MEHTLFCRCISPDQELLIDLTIPNIFNTPMVEIRAALKEKIREAATAMIIDKCKIIAGGGDIGGDHRTIRQIETTGVDIPGVNNEYERLICLITIATGAGAAGGAGGAGSDD
jgi:hypothetical protein